MKKKIKCSMCKFCENIHHQYGTDKYLGKCTAILGLKGLPYWVSEFTERVDAKTMRHCQAFENK